MSLTLAELESVRRQLEKVAPDIRDWRESDRLYGAVADTLPDGALPGFVSGLDTERPETAALMAVLAPHLDPYHDAQTLNHVAYQASRNGNTDVLASCWDCIHPDVQDQVLHEAGRKQDTDMLTWVLARRDFSQNALEESLMNSVWQGERACTDLLLGLVDKPWRVLDRLRKKGDPGRLMEQLDEAWGAAIIDGRGAVPDGRVLTAKFQADMPQVSHLAVACKMDKRLPEPKTRPVRPGGRM